MQITINIPDLRERPLPHLMAVFLGLLLLYAFTAPRTIALEDDGLFVMASYFNGIPHPPGYPLFALLGHLFSYLPLGSIAYRVHLVSAVFGAAGCALVWWIVFRITRNQAAGYLAGLGLGVSSIFWSQSIIAEVYTLNAFFFFLLFALLLESQQARGAGRDNHARRMILWASFAYGLSLSNHWPLMVLATPGLVVLAYPVRGLLAREWWRSALALLAGLAPYAWMVARSNMDPVISFQGPIESWGEFWGVVSREAFQATDRSVSATAEDKVQYIVYTIRLLLEQFLYAGAALAVVGLLRLFRGDRRLMAAGIAVALVSTLAGLLIGLSFDHDWIFRHVYSVYLLVPFGLVAIMMAAGYTTLLERFVGDRYHGYAIGVLAFALAVLFATSLEQNVRSSYTWSKEYARAVLETVPPDSVVFVDSDIPMGVLGYFHFVEKRRPDIDIYTPRGFVFSQGIVDPRLPPLEKHDKRIRFILATERPVVFTSKYSDPGIDTYSNGLYYLFTPDAEKTAFLDSRLVPYFSKLANHRDLSDDFTRFHYYALSRRLGETLALSSGQWPIEVPAVLKPLVGNNPHLQVGVAQGLIIDRRNAANAIRLSRQLLRELPDTAPRSYSAALLTSLGWGLAHTGQPEQGIAYLRNAVEIYPKSDNEAIYGLLRVYKQLGMTRAYTELKNRFTIIDTASGEQTENQP